MYTYIYIYIYTYTYIHTYACVYFYSLGIWGRDLGLSGGPRHGSVQCGNLP